MSPWPKEKEKANPEEGKESRAKLDSIRSGRIGPGACRTAQLRGSRCDKRPEEDLVVKAILCQAAPPPGPTRASPPGSRRSRVPIRVDPRYSRNQRLGPELVTTLTAVSHRLGTPGFPSLGPVIRMWPRVGSGGGHARARTSLFPCRLWPEDQPGCQPYLYGLFPAPAGPGSLFISALALGLFTL